LEIEAAKNKSFDVASEEEGEVRATISRSLNLEVSIPVALASKSQFEV